jgi:hypothetical protein
VDGRASEKEYAIATTINISKPYYGYVGVGDAIYDMQRFDFANGGMINPIIPPYYSTNFNFYRFANLSIIYKNYYVHYLLSEEKKSLISYQRSITVLSFEDSKDINKICDLGDVFISTWNIVGDPSTATWIYEKYNVSAFPIYPYPP